MMSIVRMKLSTSNCLWQFPLAAKGFNSSYFSHPRQSSENHAPKCLPFSILCAKSVIIHTSITYNMIKTGVGVNCNQFKVKVLKNNKTL